MSPTSWYRESLPTLDHNRSASLSQLQLPCVAQGALCNQDEADKYRAMFDEANGRPSIPKGLDEYFGMPYVFRFSSFTPLPPGRAGRRALSPGDALFFVAANRRSTATGAMEAYCWRCYLLLRCGSSKDIREVFLR